MQSQLRRSPRSSTISRNQKILGFTEAEGVRDRMTKAAAAVERIIHEDMTWLSEADAHKLLISLLTMRRYEGEYRLTRSTLMQNVFVGEFKKFTTLLDGIVAAGLMKNQLAKQVQKPTTTPSPNGLQPTTKSIRRSPSSISTPRR